MNYMKKIIAVIGFFVICMPFTSMAHEGHGETGGFTIIHYFSEPIHVLISAGVLFVAIVCIRRLRSRKQPNGNT